MDNIMLSSAWQHFCEVDPYNNHMVEGFICRSPSKLYGALLIMRVAGRDVWPPQLIYCTPKFNYPFDRDRNYRWPAADRVEIYEKLDGTNILMFRYLDTDGKPYVSYKTRLMPFVQTHRPFYGLWNEILGRYSDIPRLSDLNPGVALAFELYGHRNQHLMKYDVPLDARVLYGVDWQGNIVSVSKLNIHMIIDPATLVSIARTHQDLVGLYNQVRAEIESRLKKIEENAYRGTEGTMWYFVGPDGFATAFKCKPETIEAIHFAASRRPSRSGIIATCYNVLEDYPEITIENLMPLLLEEYLEDKLKDLGNLILQCINYVNNLTRIRASASDILAELTTKHGWTLETHKNEIMRRMAEEYGNKNTKLVYNVLIGVL